MGDFLFSPENPEKQQQGSKHAQGPSEVIESTPDIPVPHWESENEESDIEWRNGPPKPSFIEETEIKKEPAALKEEKGNANAIDPINEAPRMEMMTKYLMAVVSSFSFKRTRVLKK